MGVFLWPVIESRTPEPIFSAEKIGEAVPRAHEPDGASATRGAGIGSELKIKILSLFSTNEPIPWILIHTPFIVSGTVGVKKCAE